MPLLTPSRLAVVLVSFSLITFFWTFGLPSRTAQPALPIIDHYEHAHVHSDPIIPPPVIEKTRGSAPTPTHHGERPIEEEDDHRWDDKGGKGKSRSAALPMETGVAEFEKDGGRWEDGVKSGHLPSTLLTAAVAESTGVDAANITVQTSSIAGPSIHGVEKHCQNVQGSSHVMVVLRTSKAELFDKLPTHLQNLISCVPNFAIFSDHAGEIDGYEVHNALDSIGSEAKRTHDEFREYQIMHADAEHKPDPKKTKDLDKWKFLPMVYKAYHLNPSARFLVFIEADTSLSWTNLLQWVNRLDYRIPYHSGAPTFMNGVQLAQRGSGIMLSQGALRRYVKSYDELYTSKWEALVGKECCGDLLLSMAMADAHVEFYPSWPLLQGEQPSTLDFSKKHWCVPAISWHHINGDDLSDMWSFEKNWTTAHGWEKPYLFRDAFADHVAPQLAAQKPDWDNLSQDTKIIAPQGRQQQILEEEERSQKHKDDEAKKEDDDEQKAKDKKEAEKSAKEESLAFQEADAAADRRKRDEDKKDEPPDWDKLAETFQDAADSAERCEKACTDVSDCVQWRYAVIGDGECHLGKVVRLGSAMKEGDGNAEKWKSGWLLERVKKLGEEWECKGVEWKFYQ